MPPGWIRGAAHFGDDRVYKTGFADCIGRMAAPRQQITEGVAVPGAGHLHKGFLAGFALQLMVGRLRRANPWTRRNKIPPAQAGGSFAGARDGR